MKNLFLTLLTLTTLLFSMSCNSSKKSKAPVKETTMWINSDYQYDVRLSDTEGVMDFANCYAVNYSEKLDKSEFGHINAEWETACGDISGFEYEKGFIYQIKVKPADGYRKKIGTSQIGDWKLIEVLSKEKDVHHQRKEVKTAWIGPKKIEVRCFSPLAPPDCKETRNQVQYGELDKNGKWEPLYELYGVPDYEEGYIYQIRYTIVYLSEFEKRMIADHPGYEVEGVEVLSKEKF